MALCILNTFIIVLILFFITSFPDLDNALKAMHRHHGTSRRLPTLQIFWREKPQFKPWEDATGDTGGFEV